MKDKLRFLDFLSGNPEISVWQRPINPKKLQLYMLQFILLVHLTFAILLEGFTEKAEASSNPEIFQTDTACNEACEINANSIKAPHAFVGEKRILDSTQAAEAATESITECEGANVFKDKEGNDRAGESRHQLEESQEQEMSQGPKNPDCMQKVQSDTEHEPVTEGSLVLTPSTPFSTIYGDRFLCYLLHGPELLDDGKERGAGGFQHLKSDPPISDFQDEEKGIPFEWKDWCHMSEYQTSSLRDTESILESSNHLGEPPDLLPPASMPHPSEFISQEEVRPVRPRPPGLEEYKKNLKAEQIISTNETNNESLLKKKQHIVERRKLADGTRYNYAASIHGAKVVSSNKEAKGASAILDEDKDKYLRNPCSVDGKFVAIELSETLTRVDSVVVANYEYYSSMVKDFKVYGSRYFPTDHWRLLGEFSAQNVRTPQRFDFPEAEWEDGGGSGVSLVRYLKVELLTHHGSEFFCTLSVFRVHGLDELESLKEEMEAMRMEVEGSGSSLPEVDAIPQLAEASWADVAVQVDAMESEKIQHSMDSDSSSPKPEPKIADSKTADHTGERTQGTEEQIKSAFTKLQPNSETDPSASNLLPKEGVDKNHSAVLDANDSPPVNASESFRVPDKVTENDKKQLEQQDSSDRTATAPIPKEENLSAFGANTTEQQSSVSTIEAHPLVVQQGQRLEESEESMSQKHQTSHGLTGGRSGGDFILKTLMLKIRSLELNQSVLERYIDDTTKAQQEALNDMDTDLIHQKEKLRNESNIVLKMAARLTELENLRNAETAKLNEELNLVTQLCTSQLSEIRGKLDDVERRHNNLISFLFLIICFSLCWKVFVFCIRKTKKWNARRVEEAYEVIHEKENGGVIPLQNEMVTNLLGDQQSRKFLFGFYTYATIVVTVVMFFVHVSFK